MKSNMSDPASQHGARSAVKAVTCWRTMTRAFGDTVANSRASSDNDTHHSATHIFWDIQNNAPRAWFYPTLPIPSPKKLGARMKDLRHLGHLGVNLGDTSKGIVVLLGESIDPHGPLDLSGQALRGGLNLDQKKKGKWRRKRRALEAQGPTVNLEAKLTSPVPLTLELNLCRKPKLPLHRPSCRAMMAPLPRSPP